MAAEGEAGMKLTVFGASGATGSQVVSQALDAGHDVVAVVRDPARLPFSHRNLTVVTADVLSPAEITEAVAGRDAVVSAFGHSRRKPLLIRTVFKVPWRDLVAMEEVVRGSGLDWTVLRPPQLTDKPLTGRYRTREGLNLRRGLHVSRADVAHLALAVAADLGTYRAALFLAD